jgi:2-oxoglutarate dehydrogenase E2 component (dihydrolipoamide succinyltransferase)
MTDQVQVLLPKLGESIHSATIVKWFKNVGDPVRLDEPLLEVSTDKVNSEIPAPVAGVLLSIHAQLQQELQVGALIAVIGSATAAPTETATGFFSPACLRLAQEAGISAAEMEKIPGTGIAGRVTRQDIEGHIAAKRQAPANVERVQMTGMRKAIADNMVRSFYEAPHATLVAEVDVTAPLQWIEREKEAFSQKYGCKITITTFVAKALVQALHEFPLINSSLEGETILVKHFVNLGIAVSVGQGLMVPVVRGAHRLDLPRLALAISEISAKARNGKLSPDDVKEGTITLTNFGMSGVQIGVPIIRYPEVAIIGVGAICKRVVPLDGDILAIRSMMHISLTFDHRVLDGMYGCGFLNSLKNHLSEVS